MFNLNLFDFNAENRKMNYFIFMLSNLAENCTLVDGLKPNLEKIEIKEMSKLLTDVIRVQLASDKRHKLWRLK